MSTLYFLLVGARKKEWKQLEITLSLFTFLILSSRKNNFKTNAEKINKKISNTEEQLSVKSILFRILLLIPVQKFRKVYAHTKSVLIEMTRENIKPFGLALFEESLDLISKYRLHNNA